MCCSLNMPATCQVSLTLRATLLHHPLTDCLPPPFHWCPFYRFLEVRIKSPPLFFPHLPFLLAAEYISPRFVISHLYMRQSAPGTGAIEDVQKCIVMIANIKAQISKTFPIRNAFLNSPIMQLMTISFHKMFLKMFI